jgi:Pentapeptide repeats (9 copies)
VATGEAPADTPDGVDWAVCSEPECIGAAISASDRCLGHLDEQELSAALKHFGGSGELDARGARIDAKLVERLIAAAPRNPDGNWVPWKALFQRATFGDGAQFEDATFGDGARFEGATFGDGARFEAATCPSVPYASDLILVNVMRSDPTRNASIGKHWLS